MLTDMIAINNLFMYFNYFEYLEIRHRSAVRIRGFHPRDRGSTPRVGTLFFLLFFKNEKILIFYSLFIFLFC